MATKSWNVPIVKLNKKEVVVDLGGGHLVNLVGLIDKIQINNDTEITNFKTIQSTSYDEKQFSRNGPIYNKVYENKVTCDIPVVSISSGGSQSYRRTRRATHRRRATRHRRRV
jgi:hypothetical protein